MKCIVCDKRNVISGKFICKSIDCYDQWEASEIDKQQTREFLEMLAKEKDELQRNAKVKFMELD